MTSLLIAASIVGYVVVALACARVGYGRARIWQLSRPRPSYAIRLSDGAACAWMGAGLTLACLTGLWPLLLAVLFVMAKPPKTPRELREQAEMQQRRIAELERELGVGDKS